MLKPYFFIQINAIKKLKCHYHIADKVLFLSTEINKICIPHNFAISLVSSIAYKNKKKGQSFLQYCLKPKLLLLHMLMQGVAHLLHIFNSNI